LCVRTLLPALVVGGLLVLVGAGCGGIDKGKLESAIKSQTNDQLKNAHSSETVSSVSCAKTSDAYHYTCVLKRDNGSTLLTVKATCTKDGTCRWRRA
jgi:hypothetical protein